MFDPIHGWSICFDKILKTCIYFHLSVKKKVHVLELELEINMAQKGNDKKRVSEKVIVVPCLQWTDDINAAFAGLMKVTS